MLKGILLGFLAYGLFAFSDACVKALGGRLSIFEIGFFAGIFACTVLPFTRARGQSWRDAMTPRRPWLVALRAVSGTLAGLFGFLSFTHLPFAEAYAIIFLAPGFVTILSVFLLGEHVGWQRWTAIAIGLAGVFLVVRPGFEAVVPAHLAAVATSLCTATTVLVLRTLGPVESRASVLGYALILSISVTGVAMVPEFRWPTGGEFALLAACGLFSALAQLGLMLATRFAAANRVAPAQYSQMVWAVLIGAVFFAEFPDRLALAGIGLIVLSGTLIFFGQPPVGRVSQGPPAPARAVPAEPALLPPSPPSP